MRLTTKQTKGNKGVFNFKNKNKEKLESGQSVALTTHPKNKF